MLAAIHTFCDKIRTLRCSPGVELGLASVALLTWLLTGCLQVQLGASRQELRMVADLVGWQPPWPIGPWLLGATGLLLILVRQRWLGSEIIQVQQQLRLRQLTMLTSALLALRLLSLWNPLLFLFPYLAVLWAPHATWAL
ncbi:MAG: hypothetical protein FJX76_17080, partial [Armatimonadetes bacterium]|nr:hypothetical protein [Armatimonadota bacterium]